MLATPATWTTASSIGRFGIARIVCAVAIGLALVVLLATGSRIAVACLLGVLLLTSWLEFDLFVYSLIFLMPLNPLLETRLPVRDITLMLRFVLFAGVTIRLFRRRESTVQWIFGGNLRKAVLIFAVVALVSLATSFLRPTVDAYRALVRLFSYTAVFFGIVGWTETREQVTRIIELVMLSTIGVGLFGIYQEFAGGYTSLYFNLYPLQKLGIPSWTGRVPSVLFHFNSLAGYLNLVIPFSIGYMLLAKEHWRTSLGMICLTVASAALYLTQSRGGLLAYGGTLLFAMYYIRPLRVTILRIVACNAVAVAILVVSFFPHARSQRTPILSEYRERMQVEDTNTTLSRLELWSAARSMFAAHPILGVGYGNYRALYHTYLPDIPGKQLDAHNLPLQLLAETGVAGFFAFFAVIGISFRRTLHLVRQPEPLNRIVGVGVCGAVIATLVHGMVDYLFVVSPQFGALFWLTLAVGAVVFETSGREPKRVWAGPDSDAQYASEVTEGNR